jgi:hypothetical protein
MKEVTGGGRRRVDFLQLVKAMDSTPLPNYAFRNQGGLRFENDAKQWGLDAPSFSSGAAYGDLDGDGAPDLVVNNVNQEAFVYRNNARSLHKDRGYLRVRLAGDGANRFGIGARVAVHAGDTVFTQEQSPARGFQSSMDYVLGFGLGPRAGVDSVRVEWPDGRVSVERGVAANRVVTMAQAGGVKTAPQLPPPVHGALLAVVEDTTTLPFVHRENDFVDFDRERLIPKMLSTEGPHLAVADVNGDGLDDVFIGGAKE